MEADQDDHPDTASVASRQQSLGGPTTGEDAPTVTLPISTPQPSNGSGFRQHMSQCVSHECMIQ